MRRHHPAAGSGIALRSNSGKEHLVRRDAQHQRQRAVAVVREEPVVPRPERHARGYENRFVPGTADLKKDFALVLELDFLVVEASRQQHPAICGEEMVARKAFVGLRALLG